MYPCGALGPLVRVQVERWYGGLRSAPQIGTCYPRWTHGYLLPDPGVFTTYQCCSL